MSLRKTHPNDNTTRFVQINTGVTFAVEKSSTKMWDTSLLFKKMPKVNNRPRGGNSPNLVTPVVNPTQNRTNSKSF
jgi:hypothetical protein